jgi:hypothetical protein
MNVNELLTPGMARVVNDPVLPGILGGAVQMVKGARRPKDLDGKIFSIFLLSSPQDPETKAINGTFCVNFYCKNLPSGLPDIELMGPVSRQIELLFDEKPLALTNYNNYDIDVEETTGPHFDPQDPEYHFNNTRIKFKLKGS